MIELYSHGTPNSHKVSIALEELGLPYTVKTIDIFKGEQFADAFVALNPNAKIPVIVDQDTDQVVFESNAILLYLADKTGQLLPHESKARWQAFQLLFFQAASIGAMFGQRAYFDLFAPEKPAYAVERYAKEGDRLTAVMERMLTGRNYFLGEYSLVDIAHFGSLWCSVHQGYSLTEYPNLQGWFDRIAARPAVQKGVTTPAPLPDFASLRSKVA